GLIPAGEEAAGVRGLELGEKGASVLAFLVLVIEREEAVRLGVDHARIGNREVIGSRRDRSGEGQGSRFRLRVEADLRRNGGPTSGGLQRGGGEVWLGGVKHDGLRRLCDV